MEQFNLDKWLQDKSCKVVTREGKDVEIIYTNSPVPHHPIVGFIDKSIYTWTIDGKLIYSKEEPDKNDLFFADEEDELTEFEKELNRIVIAFSDAHAYMDKNEIHHYTKGLLDLARKELLKDLPKWKKATECKEFDNHILLFKDEKWAVLTTVVHKGDYYIKLSDLKTLPKEE